MFRHKRWTMALILALALCLALSACGTKTAGTANASPGASASAPASAEAAATPEATSTPSPTASPTPEPITVKIQDESGEVKTLSLMTEKVVQLTGVASDGSSGGTWSSSDTAVATVDANGIVSCWKAGKTTVTYTLGDAKATCELTVTEPTVKILFSGAVKSDITLNGTWGWTIQLTSQVSPEGTEVTWSAEDASVASVDATGLVTALKAGNTNIYCKCGTAKATCIIRVVGTPPAAAAAVTATATPNLDDGTAKVVIVDAYGVPNSDFTLRVGQTYDMDYKLYNITETTVTWSIENTAIATVDANGIVTAVSVGNTKLICTCGTYKCETIVRVAKNT